MCGIAGFVDLEQATQGEALARIGRDMAQAIRHRGPESEGVWHDPSAGIVLSHRRLAIVDLSPLGRQPMESLSGRFVVSFNGEIYNFPELRATLEKEGVFFRGRSDTEVLLALIEKKGLNAALQAIEGMFAIALWDRQDRCLHLIRDRLGKKPLYTGWAGKALVFGSELRALRAHPAFAPRIDPRALDLYFRRACVPAPHCIYERTVQIPPGCRMTLDIRALEPGRALNALIEPYWRAVETVESLEHLRRKARPEAVCLEEFNAVLEACVRARLVADVPVGAFLSGGIDSSLVVAAMHRVHRGRTKTYTIGFEEAGFDEAEHAARVAAHLGTDHHETRLGPAQTREIIPSLPEIYDEPFGDVSAIPTFLVSRFARSAVTVALTGDGGDELFGGYNRHTLANGLRSAARFLPAPVRGGIAALIAARATPWWDARLRAVPQAGDKLHKLADILPLATVGERHDALTGHWPRGTLTTIPAGEPDDPARAWPEGLSAAEDMMLRDTLTYLPDDVLTKVDRATMAVALEARAPFLDRRMFLFAWSLPEAMRVRGRCGKWLLRRALAQHLPPELFERPKQGFAVPVAAWLRGPLKDWAQALIESPAEDGVDLRPVKAAWDAHLAGSGNHAARLWVFLMYAAWRKRWGNAG